MRTNQIVLIIVSILITLITVFLILYVSLKGMVRRRKYMTGKSNFDNSWNRKGKRVIVSLTTSPLRIDKIKRVLDKINPSTYDFICLNLPDTYGRTREEYKIPDWIKTYPRLFINRFGKDLGPISKVVPTMERFPDSFIVSIDDDTLYNPFFINLLGHIFLHSNEENAIVAQEGLNFADYWKPLRKKNQHLADKGLDLFRQLSNSQNKKQIDFKNENLQFRSVELIAGFGGIMYSPSSYANPKVVNDLKTLSSLSKSCFQSDDMVLSTYFEMIGVPKIAIKFSPGMNITKIVKQLDYGFEGDALHKIQDHEENYVDAIKNIYNFVNQ
jgi:hypothetical protein